MPHKNLEVKRAYHSSYNKNMTVEQKARKKETNKLWWNSPKGRYASHKNRAIRMGIEWLFTFDSWWKMWEDSGKWDQRGYSKGKYCMCRLNDEGPYSVENCRIDTTESNKLEAWFGNKVALPTGKFYKELSH